MEPKIASSIARFERSRSRQQTGKLRMNLSGSYHKGYSQHLQYLDSNKSSPKDLSPPLSEMVICFYTFNGVRRQSAPEPKLIDWRITMRVVDNAA